MPNSFRNVQNWAYSPSIKFSACYAGHLYLFHFHCNWSPKNSWLWTWKWANSWIHEKWSYTTWDGFVFSTFHYLTTFLLHGIVKSKNIKLIQFYLFLEYIFLGFSNRWKHCSLILVMDYIYRIIKTENVPYNYDFHYLVVGNKW